MLKVEDLPIKMKVTPGQSAQVQKAYFAIGGKWASGFTSVLHTDCPYLILGTLEMGLMASNKYQVYSKHMGRLVSPSEILGTTDGSFMGRVKFLEENHPNVLRKLRGRLGLDDQEDSSLDLEIELMSNDAIVRELCTWELGSGSWWDGYKSLFDTLETKFKGEQ